MHSIETFQKKTIKDCFDYFRLCKSKKVDPAISPLCFSTIWARSPGQIRLKQIWKTRSLSDIIYLIKNFLSISKNYDLQVFNENFDYKKKKNINVIISYSSKKNFDNNGNFKDSYFDSNSKKNPENIWFLISLDNYVPKKVNKNIFILSKKNKNKFSLIYLLKKIFCLIFQNKFSLFKISHYCWYEYDFAEKTKSLFMKTFKNNNIKKLLINYESVPFQNYLIKAVKKKNIRTNTIGYLHCAPWPLQTDLINRNIVLDKLYVSSEGQKNVLVNHLGWSKKKIFVIPSLRFIKKKKSELNGFIFPPYNLIKHNNYLERFENFLKSVPDGYLNKLKVRIHPLNSDSAIHKSMKDQIDKIMLKFRKKFNKNKQKISIFFGSATGVCIQALEEGTKIIHFPENERTDVFTNYFWKNIVISPLSDDIYTYKLTKYQKLFMINSEKNKFDKYFRL